MKELLQASQLLGFLGPVILLIIWWRGLLSPRALDLGPSRRIGLQPLDLFVVLVLLIFGVTLGSFVLLTFGAGSGKEPMQPSAGYIGITILAQLCEELPPLGLLVWRASITRHGFKRIGIIPRHCGRDAGTAILTLVCAIPLISGAIILASSIGLYVFHQSGPEIAHELLRQMVDSKAIAPLALMIFQAVILAPVLEEMIFRGLLQSLFVEWFGPRHRWAAVWLVATLFMAVHIGPGTFGAAESAGVAWQARPGLLVLGLILGWVYERTGNLWTDITVHAGFNAWNILIALTFAHQVH